jgi:citrate lyase subunit beta/citryl-CoA lyase
MAKHTVRRSGLTMPIVTARFVDNAWRRGCDFVILDLEDSVPQHMKPHARTLVKEAIAKIARGGTEPFTRINHEYMLADLEAVVWPGLKRIRYPKTEHAEEIERMDAIMTRLERERGIRPGSIEIDVGIETAVGVTNVYAIAAASPRIREFGASSGGYDLSRDLGVEMFVGYDQFVYIKGEAELAALALGLGVRAAPFVANTTGSVSDGERAFKQAEAARKCGFHLGLGGLNPAVVESHNRGYTPTQAEVQDAHWVLEQYERVITSGETWLEIEGRVIDRYEAARARDTIDWAAACAARDREKARAIARTRTALRIEPGQAG